MQRRLDLDSMSSRGPLTDRDVNQGWRNVSSMNTQQIAGFDADQSISSGRADIICFVDGGGARCKTVSTEGRPKEPKAWTINEKGHHVPILKPSSTSFSGENSSSSGDPSKELLSSIRKSCIAEQHSLTSKSSPETCTDAPFVSPANPGETVKDTSAQFPTEEICEDSPITQMREFVERRGLNVKASSKKALYRKICEALESKQNGGNSALSEDGPMDVSEPPLERPLEQDETKKNSNTSDATTTVSGQDKHMSSETNSADHSMPLTPVATATTPTQELSLLDDALLEGEAVSAALSSRLGRLKILRGRWANSGMQQRSQFTAVLQRASEADDCGVLVDLLAATLPGAGCSWLDLESFALLLRPAGLPRLLSGCHEPHMLAGLRALLPLLHQLGHIVASTPPADRSGGVGVNVALEERQRRCDLVAEGLVAVRADLAAAASRHANSPAAAVARACDAAIADVLETRRRAVGLGGSAL